MLRTEPSQSGLHDLGRACDLADWFQVPVAVVINKADLCPAMADEIRAACASRGIEVLGDVPFDRQVPEDLGRGIVPTEGDGPGAEALRGLCRRILDRLDAARETVKPQASGPERSNP